MKKYDGKETGKPIKGVSCTVKSCEYHDGECSCTAGSVAVGPESARCCADTVCATYRRKDG